MRTSVSAVLAAALVSMASAPAHAVKVYFNGVDVTGIANQSFEDVTVSFDAEGNVRIQAAGYSVQVIDGSNQPPATTPAPPPTSSTTSSTTVTTGTGTAGSSPAYSDSGRAIPSGGSSFNRPLVTTTTTTTATTTTPPVAPTTLPATATTTTTPPVAPTTAPASSLANRYFLITQGTGGAAVAETVRVEINGAFVREVDSAAAQVIDDITDQLRSGSNTVTMTSAKKAGWTAGPTSANFQVIIGQGHVEAGGRVVIDSPIATFTRTAADATGTTRSWTLDAR